MASGSLSSSRSSGSFWTTKQNKQFELCDRETPDRWHNIPKAVGGKSQEEVKPHYEILLKDVENIEASRVPIPRYRNPARNGRSLADEQRLLRNLRS